MSNFIFDSIPCCITFCYRKSSLSLASYSFYSCKFGLSFSFLIKFIENSEASWNIIFFFKFQF
nr:MAG TPA: hypothetical protein [Caudoviricetes sp.]